MNSKGFAVSGIVYSVLILFFLLIFGVLGVLGSRKLILDKMKNEIINELNNEVANNIYMDDSGANYPRLVDQMLPVLYNEESQNWVYADIYEKWYDYDEKMWANAVVLKSGVTKTVGQEIEEDEIALMYVWIPRFKYVMFNANGESVKEQEIEIIFENNSNSTGTVKCVDAINQTDSNGNAISEICTDISNGTIINNASTYTHPAFTFGDEDIEGFWVGKFENSTTDSDCLVSGSVDTCNKDTHIIEIKGNVTSLRNINISNMFTSIQNINHNYGINDADSHMIKNMEWGAVAYLTQSQYGRCTNGVCEEVRINNNSEYITGCGAISKDDSSTVECGIEYFNSNIYPQSSTGNIYGIFDLNGSAVEYVMGVMLDNNNQIVNSSSGFIVSPNNKYFDLYSYGTNELDYLRGKLGDATKENLNWYDDIASFIFSNNSWFTRGGYHWDGSIGGIFDFYRNGFGENQPHYSSRSILIKQ